MTIEQYTFGNGLKWLALHSNTLKGSEQTPETFDIDKEIVSYALDKNERAHTEYDWENETFTLIYNVLNPDQAEYHYETVPMTFVVKENQLITIYNDDNAYIVAKMKHYLAHHPDMTCYKFLFATLFMISESYFPYLEEIDQTKDDINRRLRLKTTKKDLLALSDIETGMVYLVSAANQNTILLEQIKGQNLYKQLSESDKEQLEDAIIEAKQLSSMTQLNAQVLQQLSGAYNNILNNNLNDNMTTLTIMSILLAVLAVITGFFGMNVPLPIADRPDAWLLIAGGGIILWIVLLSLLRYLISRK
ncbi:magnesium transporter CorA family protein [Streptococcus caprae]|uniref:Magnesium transporter CorA family protein n=1 Tax=Streptococcus caprae TaxID=1640501 RepID=A0ABV8CVU3_9STRE